MFEHRIQLLKPLVKPRERPKLLLSIVTLIFIFFSISQSRSWAAQNGFSIPENFSGDIHYGGTFRYQSPPTPGSEYFGKHPFLEWNGEIYLSVTYYGNRVFGRYTGANVFRYGSFQGTRTGNQCTVFDNNSQWTAICDREKFNARFANDAVSATVFQGRVDTVFRQEGQHSPYAGKARISDEERAMIVAFGGEGSRPGGSNSWLTVMPPSFGKFFPPTSQSFKLDEVVSKILTDDLENYSGVKMVPGSFSHFSYYRSESAPGELWVRMHYKYFGSFLGNMVPMNGWVEARTINGQVMCLRQHHIKECKTPQRSIASQRASLTRFSPKLGPITIAESCSRYEQVYGSPGRTELIGHDRGGAPIMKTISYGSPDYKKRIYTCAPVQYVLECRWGQYAPRLDSGDDMFFFNERSINNAIAAGDCVRTK